MVYIQVTWDKLRLLPVSGVQEWWMQMGCGKDAARMNGCDKDAARMRQWMQEGCSLDAERMRMDAESMRKDA